MPPSSKPREGLKNTCRRCAWLFVLAAFVGSTVLLANRFSAPPHKQLSAPFERQVLAPVLPEAPFNLRFFSTAVKTDSTGRVITGPTTDPVKNIVGAEAAGLRAGVQRFTKIMFGAAYFDGTPGPTDRIDPNYPVVTSGGQHWPHVPQPFRSWPNALALTADGASLYATLPGREGYPDWRVAVVETATRNVQWIDLRPPGETRGTRPTGLTVSPHNPAISASPYVVALNQYANFASVIDTRDNAVIGEFQTGFYAEKARFNQSGTRLYITDRFKDQVRAFRVDPGPLFTQIAEIPTGVSDLERTNPRDLDLSPDGNTLYVANTLGHTIAVIDVAADANRLVRVMPVGGLATDVKIAGRWGIVCGHETNSVLNRPETGHGLPKIVNGAAIRNNGTPLGYTPVMSDATKATTFDDLGSELNVFDLTSNLFVYRYVDFERDLSMLAKAGEVVDLHDHEAGQKIIRGSGPEQMFVRGDLLFVSQLHSDKVEVFRIDQNPSSLKGILTETGIEFTGGITPQGVTVSPDGRTVFVANMQTEDVSVLSVDANGLLSRQGFITVGVTDKTPDPSKGGNGAALFATHEEEGLRWFFTQSYSDDAHKSCGFCHWQSRHDGNQWNVGGNAVGGPKATPQNKDVSDNWPQWFEGLSNDMVGYASSCNGELINAERRTALFPQETLEERLLARDAFILRKTAENSVTIGRPELKGKAFSIGYEDMAFAQILWTQNETRRMPNPLTQFPTAAEAALIARGRQLFTAEADQGGSGCASCHHNGNRITNGETDDTFQDFNIHEPGVVSETTVDGDGPFLRLENNYIHERFGPVQDLGSRQNISSRNTKHLRSFWDSVPRWLHHGAAHSIREILLPPDSPLLKPGERGFNFRTVRTDHSRRVGFDFLGGPPIVLPTEVPITFADSGGSLAGDGRGPIQVSLDRPTPVTAPNAAYPEGRLQLDRLGTSNLAPLIALDAAGKRTINPALQTSGVSVIRETHGKTGHLTATDIEALSLYLLSLQ
jgi:DNA-binding beta-propeller fold protein YncE